MHLKVGTCSKCTSPHDLLVRDGFYVCGECGIIHGRSLEINLTSFTQSFRHTPQPYSRRTRFNKKMLSALRCRNNYTIDEHIFKHLKKLNPRTPEDILHGISTYTYTKTSKKRRRPYMFVTYYWQALGNTVPLVTDNEVNRLLHDFDAIFFAWRRLGFVKPDFPYAYLFRKLVTENDYSHNMRELTRFVRILCCPKRRLRYDNLYESCRVNVKKLHQSHINGDSYNSSFHSQHPETQSDSESCDPPSEAVFKRPIYSSPTEDATENY